MVSRICFGFLWVMLFDIIGMCAAMILSGVNDVDKLPQGYALLPGLLGLTGLVLSIMGKLPATGKFARTEWFGKWARPGR
jgi:hypothetical protein